MEVENRIEIKKWYLGSGAGKNGWRKTGTGEQRHNKKAGMG